MLALAECGGGRGGVDTLATNRVTYTLMMTGTTPSALSHSLTRTLTES